MCFGVLGAYAPTRCGMATFSASLSRALSLQGSEVRVVRVADGLSPSSSPVVAELVHGSTSSVRACADSLNGNDVAIIHHDFSVYGGADGAEVIDILGELQVPSIVVTHAVLKDPTPHQRQILGTVAAKADRIVAMSEVAQQRLCATYAVDRRKIAVIAHGATMPTGLRVKRASRPTVLTWGLLRPGKGIESWPATTYVSGNAFLASGGDFVINQPRHPDRCAARGRSVVGHWELFVPGQEMFDIADSRVGAVLRRILAPGDGIGEGRRSSIGFRSGIVDASGSVTIDVAAPLATVGAVVPTLLDVAGFRRKLARLGPPSVSSFWLLMISWASPRGRWSGAPQRTGGRHCFRA